MNLYHFHGKNVLITGGASGMGLAAAKQFAELGAQVVVIDQTKPLDSFGEKLNFLQCDVSDYEKLEKTLQEVAKENAFTYVLRKETLLYEPEDKSLDV